MLSRRQYLGWLTLGATVPVVGCAGSETTTTIPASRLSVASSTFYDGGSLPTQYTADGEDRSPPLTISAVPDGTASLSVVMDDPDAGNFVHWLLWNVPGAVREIPDGLARTETLPHFDGARQGTNGFGTVGYRGPAPPSGDPPHTYQFTLSALDTELSVPPGSKRGALETAMDGHVLGEARITATYNR